MGDSLSTSRCRFSLFAWLLVAGGLLAAPAAGDSGARALPVRGPWVSPPLATVPPVASAELGERELREIPSASRVGGGYGSGATSRPSGVREEDSLVALSRLPAIATTPAPRLSFAGLANPDGFYPPDANGAVGPNHYVQVVNVSFAVYSKSGVLLDGPWNTNTLWAAAEGSICATDNDGSATVLYDEPANRWVFAQIAVTSGTVVCFAVSQTSNPLGSYNLYEIATERFPDSPKIGVWPDSTYQAYFMGTSSGAAGQYDVYAVDRAAMLAGTAARPTQFFQDYQNLLMPADFDGTTLPPAGSGGLFYTILDGTDPYFNPSPGVDTLRLYEFKVNWTTPASSTFSPIATFTPSSGGLAAFNWTVCGFEVRNCLAQPGTAVTVDSGSWWPMPRLVYRNYGGHETLAGTWTVDAAVSGDLAAPRWFELRRSGGSWSLFQQGTQAPDAAHRWMPSLALDRDGNLALGYNVVDATAGLYPSLRFATRTPADPAGTLQGEQTLHTGTGAQTAPTGNWGDFSSMTVDPVDGCTFWFTGEYLETTGIAPWKTRIGTFQVPGCGGLAVAPLSQALCASAGSTSFAATLSAPFTATTVMSATGCPAGATCTFTPNPVVGPANTSTLTVGNLAAVASGDYAIGVVATDQASPTTTRSETVTLALTATVPATPLPASPANGATAVPLSTVLTWSAAAGATTYHVVLDDDPSLTTPLLDTTVSGTSVPVTGLAIDTTYSWRVTATNLCGQTDSSLVHFRTEQRYCDATSVAIPDNLPAGATSTISVPSGGAILDLDVSIRGTHTWVSDLIVEVTHGATTVRLVDRPGIPATTFGCGADNFDATLDDEAVNLVENACAVNPPALAGALKPNNLLSAFDGATLTGSWSLKVIDAASGDTGTLQEWCLSPTLAVPPPELTDDGFESGDLAGWSAHRP